MEWKEIARETHPCPCGECSVLVIREWDVDHQVRTRYRFDGECAPPGYESYPYEIQRDGLWYTMVRTVRSETLREVERLRNEADALFREADGLAEGRCLERWLAHFDGESKRAVWTRLQAVEPDNIWFPALPTFYRQVREAGLRDYLIRHFRANPRRALDLLGIEDPDIVRLRRGAVARMERADRLIFED